MIPPSALLVRDAAGSVVAARTDGENPGLVVVALILERAVPVHDVPRDQEELHVRQLEVARHEVKRLELMYGSNLVGHLDDHPPPHARTDQGILVGAEP